MAYDAEDVEENFNKFVQSIDQYVKGPIKDFAAIKPQLLDIFKTHCPVKVGDYQYGISKSLEENSQLIIHHLKNDHSLVREYFKSENDTWTCCECYSTSGGESSEEDIANALVLHGIVFAKLGHYCKPRRLSAVMNIQKFFKEKNIAKAIDLQRKHFGKEDLNGVSPKRKRGAGKRETKASKIVDEMDSEDGLQYTRQKHRDGQDDEPSISDEYCNESQEKLSPKEAFEKIIQNLEEYTNETKEVVMENKSHILNVLKHNRPVKLSYYLHGLTANNRENRRLIVFEWGDVRRVREYRKRKDNITDKYLWACLECHRLNWHKTQHVFNCSLVMVSGIAFVLINHDIRCEPRDYKLVRIYQRCLEEGNIAKARSVARKNGFSFPENIDMSTFARLDENYVTYLSKISTSADSDYNDSNSENEINLKRKMVSDSENDSISRDQELPILKKSKRNELATKDTVTDKENSALFEDEDFIVCEDDGPSSFNRNFKIAEMEEELPIEMISSIYHFKKPSTSKLEKTCHKLNIRYRIQANKFWDKIKFDQINILSTRIQLHSYKRSTFYQILSIFFTGKSKQHEQIKNTIIDAFREKLVSSGEISTKEFNQQYLDTVTDEHFAFIAKFLKCRIFIFDGENGIKKYGKWKSISSARLTLVVAFNEGYYSIVLNL